MYVFLDYEKIRAHEQYIEKEKKEVSKLCEWAKEKRNISEDTYEYQRLSGIVNDLEQIQRSMTNRLKLMEEIIREFRDDGKSVEHDIDMIKRALDDLDINIL